MVLQGRVGRDPITGRPAQVTKRGFRTAADAGRARRELLAQVDTGLLTAASAKAMTVNELLDRYFEGAEADGRPSLKTRRDYGNYAEFYIRPLLGNLKVRDVTPQTSVEWQRRLAKTGGHKAGKALPSNTIRLARAPLVAAFKVAIAGGIVTTNPMSAVPRPTPQRKIPKHWSPEEAQKFLALMEGDRTYPIWAFLLGSGVRIGELVWLRWPNVDLDGRRVRIVEFATTIDHEL
ncbi:MAG: Arm DNA-binding domain-containing protein, partial [Acidimicrobiia bacterium]|nr:Arm DNA-binding domain-containing protein [Acidimicrobiia bacterium]